MGTSKKSDWFNTVIVFLIFLSHLCSLPIIPFMTKLDVTTNYNNRGKGDSLAEAIVRTKTKGATQAKVYMAQL